MNLTKLTLVQRLTLCFAVLAALLVLLLGLSLKQIGSLRSGIDELVNQSFPKTVWANDYIDSISKLSRSARTLLIASDDLVLVGTVRADIDAAEKVAEDSLSKLDKAITSVEGRKLFDALNTLDEKSDLAMTEFLRLFDAGQFEQAKVFLLKDLRTVQLGGLDGAEKLIVYQSELVARDGHSAEAAANSTIQLLMVIGGFAILLAVVLAFLLISNVKRQLGADPAELARITGRIADLPDALLKKLAEHIHEWRIKPSGNEGYRTAEVTLGGVDTHELSSKTMEVKNVPGLYFIGEVVDVTGWLGGYNFQWAWSSGFAAGQHV